MWSELLAPGLGLLDGATPYQRLVAHELVHRVVHRGSVALWIDGDHGFNPYDFAELNLTRGFEADDGATRVLVKRCMTPFQWDDALTKHIAEKLATTPAGLVLALPYDLLYSTDELQDWERMDYVRYGLSHLEALARRHDVPILLGADVRRWTLARPALARLACRSIQRRWRVGTDARDRLRLESVDAPRVVRQLKLRDFVNGRTL